MEKQLLRRLIDETAIGGLLHDVGKPVQRGGREKLNHMEQGGRWLEALGEPWASFAWAARFHHSHPNYALRLSDFDDPRHALSAAAIAEADSLSAAEREDLEGTGWDKDAPLRNVCDEIRLEGRPRQERRPTFFDLTDLDGTLPFPSSSAKRSLGADYAKITSALADLLADTKKAETSFLLRALERYTALVPSDTACGGGRYPDISLFDHLRTTAMLAVCLVVAVIADKPELLGERRPEKIAAALGRLYKEAAGENAPFLLVGGDLRGVQRFIYDISTARALRLLRTRSFYLEILQEHILSTLLDELDLPRTQVLYVGGGHFTLLLPNTAAVRSHLRTFDRGINEALLDEGSPALSLGWTSLAWRELKEGDVRQAYRRLSAEMELGKVRPLKGLLSRVIGADDTKGRKSCPICGGLTDRLVDDDGPCCPRCADFVRLGGRLARPESRYACPVEKGGDFHVLGRPYRLVEEGSDIPPGAPWAFVLREPRRLSRDEGGNVIALPWEIYSYDSRIETLLDEGSVGARRLAALRLDVDNLGRLFREGFPDTPEETRRYSLSRLATLSRLLSLFFREGIAQIASTPQTRLIGPPSGKRRLLVVYAGGDDLFVIGAWNEVAEFAIDTVRAFRAFTGDNADVTLSGGLVLIDDKTPVYQAARLAGEAEDHAKDHRFGERTKDSLTFFHVPLVPGKAGEDRAFNVREELPRLEAWIGGLAEQSRAGKGNRAFLRHLMALRERQMEGDALWKIHGAYAAGRSNDTREKHLLGQLLQQSDELRMACTAAQWVDLALRRTGD